MKKDDCIRVYNDVIRQMIWHENEIRNQRTNWFLVIQGFLITGICQQYCKPLMQILIVIIGIITALSFHHAAWRSSLAVRFAFTCWKNKLKEENLKEGIYPPISLITKEILEVSNLSGNKKYWKAQIQNLMYSPNKEYELCFHKIRNKFDFILPYRLLPIVFLLFWIIMLVSLMKEVDQSLVQSILNIN